MATVKVQRVKGINPNTKQPIYYVRTKSTGTMSTSDLIDNIVREGQIPRIYAQGVLDYLTTAIFDIRTNDTDEFPSTDCTDYTDSFLTSNYTDFLSLSRCQSRQA